MKKERKEVQQCTKCGKVYPYTLEYFHASWVKNRKTGDKEYHLRGMCKKCRSQQERTRQINQASYIRAAKIVYSQMKREGLND